jgi:hypothetical protein
VGGEEKVILAVRKRKTIILFRKKGLGV